MAAVIMCHIVCVPTVYLSYEVRVQGWDSCNRCVSLCVDETETERSVCQGGRSTNTNRVFEGWAASADGGHGFS